MIRTEHVRDGEAFHFPDHGDESLGSDCAGTKCVTCGCCQHCQHPCDCTECGCEEWGDKVEPPRERAELHALRDKLALIEVTVALWEAGAVEMEREMTTRVKASQSERRMRVAARVNRAHAEVIRDILKGE